MSPSTSSVSFARLVGASITVILTALCTPAISSEPGCSKASEHVENPGQQASQVVSIDPNSGELVRAKAPEDYRLAQRDSGPVVTRELPDGTVVAEVGDRFRAHLIAEVVDGKLVTCHRTVQNHSDAKENKEELDE